MKSSKTKFLALVFMLTLLCIALQWTWNSYMPEKFQCHAGFLLLGIFASTVTLTHLLLINAKKDPGNSFVRAFMLSSTLKFFFYLSVLVLFLLYGDDSKQALALHFLFYYFAFNTLEISMLYTEVKRK